MSCTVITMRRRSAASNATVCAATSLYEVAFALDSQTLHTSTHIHHLCENYTVLSGETDERPVARPHQCVCLREISEKWRRNQEEPVFMKEP